VNGFLLSDFFRLKQKVCCSPCEWKRHLFGRMYFNKGKENKTSKHLNNSARKEAEFCCEITQWEQVDPEDSANAQQNINTISLASTIKALHTQWIISSDAAQSICSDHSLFSLNANKLAGDAFFVHTTPNTRNKQV